MNYYVHPQGLCESQHVGDNTRIWAFSHILPNAIIGSDCNICDHVFIENNVRVGDRVTIKSGVQLWDGVVIEDDVFIGPNVTFTNDKFPRSKHYPETFLPTHIAKGASIGANVTLLPGLKIGQNAMVGAGSVVTKSVPANAIVVGNPARVVSFVASTTNTSDSEPLLPAMNIRGVSLHQSKVHSDSRGALTVGEFEQQVPFTPKRYFIVYDNFNDQVRGEHAHKECQQFLICVKGTCHVLIEDGYHRDVVVLNSPSLGLYMKPMVWSSQYRFSPDAVLLVFASEFYDPADYIRSHEEYLSLVTSRIQI